MLTFLYLLICWALGDVSVNIDIIYATAAIDIAVIVSEAAYKIYKVKHGY